MKKTNNTVFQNVNNIFNPSNRAKTNTDRRFGEDLLHVAKTEEEFERKRLQAQQDKYLAGQWRKSSVDNFQRAMVYEVTRYASFADYERMEFFPEIASALDIYMEEATTTKGGVMLNIKSESKRVQLILENLFYDRLKINASLPMWTRNVAKYGDNFVLLNISSELGVIEGRQLPVIEVDRREGDFVNKLQGDGDHKTKFIWSTQNLEFNEWQVAHFRLLGDDRFLPYGTSILNKCRRIYKQLTLAEDAMLVYRVTRAPERRVFKINVGNIDDKDVPAYINEIANRFKRTPIVDSKTGNIDLEYNQLSNDEDFFIPVRDENAPNPIDTLSGANNLDAIADIEFLQNKLCIALRIPKTFLGFSDSVGEGKNLALMDIRFAKSVNRLQQAMIQELNKIAIVHLYTLGFEDEVSNFELTLNNPSNASEMLGIEQLLVKADAFIKLVSDAGDGFKIMSRTKASKLIFNESDEDIIKDLLQQRLEKATSAEMEKTASIIKHTGIFDKIDRIYGDLEKARDGGGESDGESDGGGSAGGGGGFGGGMDFGDDALDDDDFGDGEDDNGESDGLDEELGEINFDEDIDADVDDNVDNLNELTKIKNFRNVRKQMLKEGHGNCDRLDDMIRGLGNKKELIANNYLNKKF